MLTGWAEGLPRGQQGQVTKGGGTHQLGVLGRRRAASLSGGDGT